MIFTIEHWTPAFVAGGAHFVFVFFKAMQQRNVAFMHYKWVMPISFFMSSTEVAVFSLVAVSAVQTGTLEGMIPFGICMGTGGGIGALLAMWVHDHFITRKQ